MKCNHKKLLSLGAALALLSLLTFPAMIWAFGISDYQYLGIRRPLLYAICILGSLFSVISIAIGFDAYYAKTRILWLSISVIVCGVLGSFLAFICFISPTFDFHAGENAWHKINRIKSDFNKLAVLINRYRDEHSVFPSYDAANYFIDNSQINYPDTIIRDPYSRDRTKPFYRYYSDANGWILISAGPDCVWDIDPIKDYDSSSTRTLLLLSAKAYDPTNGIISEGDIFLTYDSRMRNVSKKMKYP